MPTGRPDRPRSAAKGIAGRTLARMGEHETNNAKNETSVDVFANYSGVIDYFNLRNRNNHL